MCCDCDCDCECGDNGNGDDDDDHLSWQLCLCQNEEFKPSNGNGNGFSDCWTTGQIEGHQQRDHQQKKLSHIANREKEICKLQFHNLTDCRNPY
ncbi:hypothetical protein ACLKA7_004793 [Drosophila subpalustris]